MTDDELAQAFAALRPLVTNIIGFHELAEDEDHPPLPADRIRYEAHVYGGGLALAMAVLRIADALDSRR